MLKIKNNIDLIELEIFNFYDMGNCYQKYLEFGVQLYVDKQTRIITRNAPYDARYIPNKDEISDLIKADIVEDVAEEITYAYGVNLEEDIIIIEKQQKRIGELEQELAELKEKAIARPKFEHFEECWYIENNPYCDNELQVFNGKVMEIICAYDEDWLYEYRFDTSCRYIEENNIFATEREAQAKLKEIQGNE